MLDIRLCTKGEYEGDIELTEDGDFRFGNSALQNAKVIVGWILGEWRLGPDLGIPWYEDIWIKNPNLNLIQQEISSAIMKIEEVTDASVKIVEYNRQKRTLKVAFTISVDGDTYSEEVEING